MKQNTPEKIYKYCDLKSIAILETCTLKFTPPNQCNDSRECLIHYCQAENTKFFLEAFSYDKKLFMENWSCINQYLSAPDTAKRAQQLRDRYSGKFGICCFSECITSTNMWGIYADKNTGFAIEFDTKKLPKLFKISYGVRSPVFDIDFYNDDEYGILGRLLDGLTPMFTKDIVWEHEKEWRSLELLEHLSKITSDNGQDIFLYPLDPNAISAIFLGTNTSPKTKDIIKNIAQNNNIDCKYYQMELYPYNLTPREISF